MGRRRLAPNAAFWEQYGPRGWEALATVRQAVPADIPVLLDTLAQSSGDLAQAAKATLVGLSSEQVDQQLCARLPQVTGNARRTFVELAGLRRVTAAWPELVKAANDADPYIRIDRKSVV